MKRPSEYMIMTDGVSIRDYAYELDKYADYLEAENKKLRFMVDNGLGEEDFKNDITFPTEL